MLVTGLVKQKGRRRRKVQSRDSLSEMTERIRKSISMQSTCEMETNGTENKHRKDVVHKFAGHFRQRSLSKREDNTYVIHFYCVIPSLCPLYVFNR